MLINLSNHLSDKWEPEQIEAARQEFGSVIDLPFPPIDPNADESEVSILAGEYVEKCMAIFKFSKNGVNAVHTMGESNICFTVICKLLGKGMKCVASTTERVAEEGAGGEKVSRFKFVRFREYGFN